MMKHFSFIHFRSVLAFSFVLFLVTASFEVRSNETESKTSSANELSVHQDEVSNDPSDETSKMKGQGLVDFIRELLGNKPLPINKDLIRDEE